MEVEIDWLNWSKGLIMLGRTRLTIYHGLQATDKQNNNFVGTGIWLTHPQGIIRGSEMQRTIPCKICSKGGSSDSAVANSLYFDRLLLYEDELQL